MTQIAVLPGSFDPLTLGHLDVIRRATGLAEHVRVLVVHNPDKAALLPGEERAELIRRVLDDEGLADRASVDVRAGGLLADYVAEVGAAMIVKGLRSQLDVAYEAPMALVNRDLTGIETVFLVTDPAHALVSSSLVRQVASLGGDVRPYVPGAIAERLRSA